MCGIAGLISRDGAVPDPELPMRMSRCPRHRGPDDRGWLRCHEGRVESGHDWPDGLVPLGAVLLHRRLSILDLRPTGWQPMSTPDGRFHLAFNGEIYNFIELRTELEREGHTFRSTSDTEVLLAAFQAWGLEAVPRFLGMFAFAILDREARKLVLVRDFFGIKPLYYAVTPGYFAFASEIKSLLEVPGQPRSVDAQRLFDYLRFGLTAHAETTLYSGIRQVPPAHYAEIALDRPDVVHVAPYWEIDTARTLDISFDEAADRLRELFLDSVRLHLRSDVPVGAALSGGIDSSAIVMAMRAVQGDALDLRTFSYVADDGALSEERWVDLVGDRAAARVAKVHTSPAELVADLDELIALQDEPFTSTSIYAQYRVFKLAREHGVTVMLDGQGADELLGGYPGYSAARFSSLVRRGEWGEAATFLARVSKLPGRGGTLLRSGQFLAPARMQAQLRRLARQPLVPSWMDESWFARRNVDVGQYSRRHPGTSVLKGELLQSLTQSSLPMLLRYEDRNSMAHSIESRVPFLTHKLAEFVFSLPEDYLIDREGTTKAVFRRAMRGVVPDEILDRKDKIGFATPERRWLDALRPWVETVLRGDAARRVGALDLPRVTDEWNAVLAGRARFDFRVWRWINLIRWADLHGVDFDALG
jgi:asparagine synthase (glutamine-hydrolysing)